MIGIQAIGWATGAAIVDNAQQARRWGKDEAFVTEKIGFRHLTRLAEGQSILSLSLDALRDLQTRTDFAVETCESLIVVTQTPDNRSTVPHMSARLHGALGMPVTVAAFDMGLGCSGYVYALSVATTFMKMHGYKKGLLFTADAYSPFLQKDDVHTQLLFGDAAACTLLSDTPKYILKKSCFATSGESGQAIEMHNDGTISMNGREVFNFCMLSIPKQIEECLKKNKMRQDEIDSVVLHQASRYIVDAIGRRAGFTKEQTTFMLHDIGNCISSTIPIAIDKIWEHNHDHILISGFGVGLSWATTILQLCGE